MYSTHHEGKFVVAESFFWILKNKIYKYMNLISENVYIGELAEYNNTYHRIMKMKPVGVKPNTNILTLI